MRKCDIKQITELLQTLSELHSELDKYKNTPKTLEVLLNDGFDFACVVKNHVAGLVGEKHVVIGLFDDYASILKQVKLADTTHNVNKKIKSLKSQLFKIENKVRGFKPDKIEVLFLPYKRAMSDCLESIWLSAMKDPSCDVCICPIPYYDRLPDGKFSQMHLEGDEYDENLPLVDWQDYDIEARSPDVIFVMNPYDQGNYVTSVHPNFYSERLHRLTDCLVYVPYFVSIGDLPEHFVINSGCVYAHKVFVQSEEVRNTYVRIFKENFGDKCGKPNDKFVVLGSPKFDKVLNTKREDCDLPDDWRKLIENPDGTRKKVIFYNTTINAALKYDQQYLEKLRHVFDVFKERKDVVLWWRPHPLLEQTINSLRPQLAKEYCDILMAYKDGNVWGIYDDTSDLSRAIAHADILFSDPSSIIPLFAVTRKPIIEQSADSLNNELDIRDVRVRFGDFVFGDDGVIWAFELFRDGLFKLDFKENFAEFVLRSNSIPQYFGKKFSTHRYINLHLYKNELICFPSLVDNILIYNITSGGCEKLAIDKSILHTEYADGFAISTVIKYKSKYYCFSPFSKMLIVFDAEDKSIEYQKKIFDDFGLMLLNGRLSKVPIYFSDVDDHGNVELLLADSDKIVRYNLVTQHSEVISENEQIINCKLADRDANNIWLFNDSMTLFCWNIEDNQVSEYPLILDGFCAGNQSVFSGLADCGDYLLLFPTFSSMIIRFDKDTLEFSEYTNMPIPQSGNTTTYKYDRYKRVGNKIYAFARFNSTIYELDIRSGKIIEHSFIARFPEEYSMVEFSNETPKFVVEADGEAGQRIYEYTKSLILGRGI